MRGTTLLAGLLVILSGCLSSGSDPASALEDQEAEEHPTVLATNQTAFIFPGSVGAAGASVLGGWDELDGDVPPNASWYYVEVDWNAPSGAGLETARIKISQGNPFNGGEILQEEDVPPTERPAQFVVDAIEGGPEEVWVGFRASPEDGPASLVPTTTVMAHVAHFDVRPPDRVGGG